MLKKGIRILGIDDSTFESKTKNVLIVGTVYRDGIIEGVLSTKIIKDGDDSTRKVIKMLKQSRFLDQVKLIMTNGIMLAGFNVVDINELHRQLNIPVVAVTRKKADMARVLKALSHLKKGSTNKKIGIIEGTEPQQKVDFKGNSLYYQSAGIDRAEVVKVIKRAGIEPIRLSHIIGSGIIRGESSGRI